MKKTKISRQTAEIFLRLSIPKAERKLLIQEREKERQNDSDDTPTAADKPTED